MKIQFTEIEAIQPEILSKSYILENGAVTKLDGGQLVAGRAFVKHLEVAEIIPYLKALDPSQALVYGVPQADEAVVVSQKLLSEGFTHGESLPLISRDNRHFAWAKSPGIMMADYDPKGGEKPLSREQLLERLYAAWPALQHAPHVWAPSASSSIFYPDGREYRGLCGQRIFIPVACAADIPLLSESLIQRLWLTGQGYIAISKAGAMLLRTLLDTTVWQPSHLDFAGGAHCVGLIQRRQELIAGYTLDGRLIDRLSLPPCSRPERREVQNLINRAKNAKRKQANQQKAAYIRERLEGLKGEERETTRRVLNDAVRDHVLGGPFLLHFDGFGAVTVAEALRSREKYHKARLADPLEPDYHGDNRIAIFYAGTTTTVYSHAHGGIRYTLVDDQAGHTPLDATEEIIPAFLRSEAWNKALVVPPGVGKTRLGIQYALELSKTGRVLYVMPNHRLISSHIERICVLEPPVKIRQLKGRQWNQKGYKNCHRYAAIQEVTHEGHAPAPIVCIGCDGHPKTGKKPCKYYRQTQDLPKNALLFAATQALPYKLTEVENISHIIIDENAAAAMVHEIDVSAEQLKTVLYQLDDHTGQVLKNLLARVDGLVKGMVDEQIVHQKFYVDAFDDELSLLDSAEITARDLALLKTGVDALASMKSREIYAAGVNANALTWLQGLCTRTGNTRVEIMVNKKVTIHYKHSYIPNIPADIPITILDATANLAEVRALFKRDFEVLQVNVPCVVNQIWIRQRMGKTAVMAMSLAQIEKNLRLDMDHVPETIKTALILTFKDRVNDVVKIAKKLRPDIEWKFTHYWGSRGLNDFEDCEAVIAFGVPYQNPSAAEDMARTIFGDDKSLRDTWCLEQGGNELYQGVHRLRFVRNPGRILIVHGGYYPAQLLGPATKTVDVRDREKITDFDLAIERAIDFVEEFGAISKRYCWLLGIGQNSEQEKIQKLKHRFMAETAKATSSKHSQTLDMLIRYILIRQQEFVTLFSDTAFWTKFWKELRRCIPLHGNLEVKHADIDKRNYRQAYGTVDAGRKLDALFADLGFEPGIWRTDEEETSVMERKSEQEISVDDRRIVINIPEGTTGPLTINLNLSFPERTAGYATSTHDDPPKERHLHLVKPTKS